MSSFLHYAGSAHHRTGLVKIFFKSQSMAVSADFFRFYFLWTKLSNIYNERFHSLTPILLFFNTLSAYLLVGGSLGSLYALYKEKILWRWNLNEAARLPAVFYLSGVFTIISVMLPLVKIDTHVYYHLVFIPCYSILIGYAASRFWKFWPYRLLIGVIFISIFALLGPIYSFVEKSGGYVWEYGVHYGQLLKWKQQISRVLPPGECPVVQTSYIGSSLQKGIFVPETIDYALNFDRSCRNSQQKPVRFYYRWNVEGQFFEEKIVY